MHQQVQDIESELLNVFFDRKKTTLNCQVRQDLCFSSSLLAPKLFLAYEMNVAKAVF